MKIIIDTEVPFIKGVFEPYAEVEYLFGSEINPETIKDADALIVKGHTRCDAALLEGSAVKIIATTLVSIDHIDIDYCNKKGIYVQNAKGTIGGAVSNYVFSAIYGCAAKKSINLTNATMGIIGYGSVGMRIEAVARALGFKVLIEDPPKANVQSPSQFCDLDHLLANSDVVTLHVPLNERTKGMADSDFFSKMKYGAMFINTANGALVVDDDLINAVPKLGAVIIDCWNNAGKGGHRHPAHLRLLLSEQIGRYQSNHQKRSEILRLFRTLRLLPEAGHRGDGFHTRGRHRKEPGRDSQHLPV